MKKNKTNLFVIWFVKITGIIPTLIFFKPRIHYINREVQSLRLPKPCILMSNHMSLMDFALYLLIFPFRTVRFLISEALYCKNAVFAWFLNSLGGIYVNRDTYDFSFVGEALESLDNGTTVGIFPEGRLPVKGEYHPFRPSIVYIALRTDAPIIPIYTNGVYRFNKRAQVMIGEPVYLRKLCQTEEPDSAELERLTKYLEEEEARLKHELERRLRTDEKR